MTKKKIAEYIATIKSIFSYAYKDLSADELRLSVNTWFALLKDYDETLTDKAFYEVMRFSKTPPVPADIIEKIQKYEDEKNGVTPENLWKEVLYLIAVYDEQSAYFGATVREANGKTQEQNARERIKNKFYNSNPIVREFIGSISNLFILSETENLKYERARFFKNFSEIRERIRFRDGLFLEGKGNEQITG